jgi:hypothetical protein
MYTGAVMTSRFMVAHVLLHWLATFALGYLVMPRREALGVCAFYSLFAAVIGAPQLLIGARGVCTCHHEWECISSLNLYYYLALTLTLSPLLMPFTTFPILSHPIHPIHHVSCFDPRCYYYCMTLARFRSHGHFGALGVCAQLCRLGVFCARLCEWECWPSQLPCVWASGGLS